MSLLQQKNRFSAFRCLRSGAAERINTSPRTARSQPGCWFLWTDSSFGPRFCDCILNLVSMTTVRTLILKLWLLLAYFSYFGNKKKNESRLMRSPCCRCVYPPFHELLNARTNLYEAWYVYHDTWTYLNGILYKYLPTVCVCLLLLLLYLFSLTTNRFLPGDSGTTIRHNTRNTYHTK
jgi:hypothetical protein